MARPLRPNCPYQTPAACYLAHQEITVNTTLPTWSVKRPIKLTRVTYINPAGLVSNGTDYVTIILKRGANVVTSLTTELGVGDDIPAGVELELDLPTSKRDRVIRGEDDLVVEFAVNGTPTLPPGTLQIAGLYV